MRARWMIFYIANYLNQGHGKTQTRPIIGNECCCSWLLIGLSNGHVARRQPIRFKGEKIINYLVLWKSNKVQFRCDQWEVKVPYWRYCKWSINHLKKVERIYWWHPQRFYNKKLTAVNRYRSCWNSNALSFHKNGFNMIVFVWMSVLYYVQDPGQLFLEKNYNRMRTHKRNL